MQIRHFEQCLAHDKHIIKSVAVIIQLSETISQSSIRPLKGFCHYDYFQDNNGKYNFMEAST